jgi:hypothetical protein
LSLGTYFGTYCMNLDFFNSNSMLR